MAIEDSITLSLCLSSATTPSEIPKALKTFETIRKPRTSLISSFGEKMARTWQLPDGPEQEARDEVYRKTPYFGTTGWDGTHIDELPGLPPDPLFFPYMLAHDVVDFVSEVLESALGMRAHMEIDKETARSIQDVRTLMGQPSE